jgi:16S rRNA (guanine966-N2)-methyltransferase
MDMNSGGKREILTARRRGASTFAPCKTFSSQRFMARSEHTRKVPKSSARNALPNRVRVIGGQWRGRLLAVPPLPAVRPSPDRVRETLFNWLQPTIPGARCLDLFAGTGALGIEALSRGAAEVVFVDREPQIGRHLRETLETLRADNASVHVMDAVQFLQGAARPFDVVFLDPPFASDLLVGIFERLALGWLAPEAFVYAECSADKGLPALPAGWQVHRTKRAGQVGYHLLRVIAAAPEGIP